MLIKTSPNAVNIFANWYLNCNGSESFGGIEEGAE